MLLNTRSLIEVAIQAFYDPLLGISRMMGIPMLNAEKKYLAKAQEESFLLCF